MDLKRNGNGKLGMKTYSVSKLRIWQLDKVRNEIYRFQIKMDFVTVANYFLIYVPIDYLYKIGNGNHFSFVTLKRWPKPFLNMF